MMGSKSETEAMGWTPGTKCVEWNGSTRGRNLEVRKIYKNGNIVFDGADGQYNPERSIGHGETYAFLSSGHRGSRVCILTDAVQAEMDRRAAWLLAKKVVSAEILRLQGLSDKAVIAEAARLTGTANKKGNKS